MRHAGQGGQHIHMQPLIIRGVGDDHPEQIIRIAGHQIAFHDLRAVLDAFFKFGEFFLGLFFDRDLDKNIIGQFGGVLRHNRHITINDIAVFKRLDPPQAGRRRQADLIRKIIVADPAIPLQDFQNGMINSVQA